MSASVMLRDFKLFILSGWQLDFQKLASINCSRGLAARHALIQ